MTQPPVTLVTHTARAADNLTDAEYRDIYDELRQQHSLRQFVQITHTAYSIAWWSKYEHDSIALTRQARNELRAAVGLQPLPLTVRCMVMGAGWATRTTRVMAAAPIW